MPNPIAGLPDDLDCDCGCSVCGDDNLVVVIKGTEKCHHCGNEVLLCSKCFHRMLREIEAMKIDDRPLDNQMTKR